MRIVTVDDHPIFRDGLRRLLESQSEFEVVGEAASGEEAVELVRKLAPDVLLLDLALPDMSGLDVLRSLSGSSARILLLTAAIDRPDIIDALRLGARGLVLKTSATSLLFKALRSVMAGQYWLGHDSLSDLVDALKQFERVPPPTPIHKLTRRELEIISAIVNGASNRDISKQFGLSEQTVKNHMSHIFDKVGVSNRLELALFVVHHRLLDPRRPGT